jgi:hypothetical protein
MTQDSALEMGRSQGVILWMPCKCAEPMRLGDMLKSPGGRETNSFSSASCVLAIVKRHLPNSVKGVREGYRTSGTIE